MSNVQVSQDFQSRLFDKIKTDIGSLMTDDELKALVASAIERIWFTKSSEYVNYRTIEKPPELLTVVREALAVQVRAAVDDWLKANPDAVQAAISEALKGGLASAVLGALDFKLQNDFNNLKFGLQNALSQIAQR